MAPNTPSSTIEVAAVAAPPSQSAVVPELASTYVQYLPAIFQQHPFVGRFLLAFERVLSGLPVPVEGDSYPPGLEQSIEYLYTYFKPIPNKTAAPPIPGLSNQTPDEFLPWLASWVALSLREEWEPETKRQFISEIVPLYRLRGTKAGLQKILQLYLKSANLPEKVEIYEFDQPAFFFQVRLVLPTPDPNRFWQQARIAKSIIDQEKPAHTFYALKIQTPTMQLSGKVYPLRLKAPGQIRADFTGTTSAKLALRIQQTQVDSNDALFYQQSAIAQQIGQHSLSVSATASPESSWAVTITNLSTEPIQGTVKITITYSAESGLPAEEQEMILTPALKSGLYLLKDRAQGGNTFLGAV
jgi:phage tail-like protein